MALLFKYYGQEVTFVVNGTLRKGIIDSFPFNGVVDIKETETGNIFYSVKEEDIKIH